MKSIKSAIIVLVILIGFVAILLLSYSPNSNEGNSELADTNQNVKEEKELTQVKSASAFFTAQNCANKYLGYVSEKDSESIFRVLDYNYIEQNGITSENVMEKIDNIPEQAQLKVEKMYLEKIDDNNSKYYMTGLLVQDTSEGDILLQDNFSIAVILDFENMIFSIIPLENGGV